MYINKSQIKKSLSFLLIFTMSLRIIIPIVVAAPKKPDFPLDVNVDFSNSICYGTSNPYKNYKNSCTWFAWGRIREKTNIKLPFWHSAEEWYADAQNEKFSATFKVGPTPKANSIAVWSGRSNGHVAVVERVTNEYVYLSHGGASGLSDRFPRFTNSNCVETRETIKNMQVGQNPSADDGLTLIGYIYPLEKTYPIKSISVTSALTLTQGTSKKLNVKFTPSNTTSSKTVSWKSSNPSIVTVDGNGNVRAIKAGVAKIIGTSSNNKTSTCRVTVKAKPLIAFRLNTNSLYLNPNQSFTLKVTSYNPSNTTSDKTATWTSSNLKVATVDRNGKVTAVGFGLSKITCKVAGKKQNCTVAVKR